LLANPGVQAGDRVVAVNGPEQALTGPQKTALGSAINVLFGVTPVGIDSFWCSRKTGKDCRDDDQDPGTPDVCTDVENFTCAAVDVKTITSSQRQTEQDAGRDVELLAHSNGNDDVQITYRKQGLSAGQRTGLGNWLNSVFSKSVDQMRAVHCRKQLAQVLCYMTDIRTVNAEQESQHMLAKTLVESYGAVVP
jgi:hypothetical protein